MTTPVPTTFEAIQATNKPQLMFKALGGFILTADIATAIPTAFTDTSSATLNTFPAAWTNLGLVPKGDGVTFSRDITSDDTESWGYNEPTRTDITGDTTSAKFTLQQTSRAALEMFDFVDLSTLTPDVTTGEVGYNKPSVSVTKFRRMIFVAVDGAGTERRYRIKIMPKAQVTAVDDEVWSQSAVTAFPITIKALQDPTLGYSVRNVLAGPGQKSRNSAAAFGA